MRLATPAVQGLSIGPPLERRLAAARLASAPSACLPRLHLGRGRSDEHDDRGECRVELINWMNFIDHVWFTFIVYKGLWPRDHAHTLYRWKNAKLGRVGAVESGRGDAHGWTRSAESVDATSVLTAVGACRSWAMRETRSGSKRLIR
jgi:hypothetical protein